MSIYGDSLVVRGRVSRERASDLQSLEEVSLYVSWASYTDVGAEQVGLPGILGSDKQITQASGPSCGLQAPFQQ